MEELGMKQCIGSYAMPDDGKTECSIGKSSNLQNNWRLSRGISHIFLFARMVKSAFSFKFKVYSWFLK